MTRGDGATICFGEMLLRLSAPAAETLFQQDRLDACFVGAEANVAVALARLGRPSALVTTLPDGPIGDGALDTVRRAGVDVRHVLRAPGRMGLYYLSPGSGLRQPAIIYDRQNSSFALTGAEAYDWPTILGKAAMLHLSGIIPALTPDTHALSLTAMKAARAAGVPVSFDGNYRASLWQAWCTDPAPVLARHVELADLFFGNARDLSLLLNTPFDNGDPQQRRAAALAAFGRFPNLRHIASTHRCVIHAGLHHLSARIDTPDGFFETPDMEVGGIVDRIGTGDAFAAGVIAHLAEGLEQAAHAGLALAALNHFIRGDMSPVTATELAAFQTGSGDVRR
ncbi:MAG: sugar kinase [Sphingomonas sp.]|nr:sugar kinase [Sphingomonas sp.]